MGKAEVHTMAPGRTATTEVISPADLKTDPSTSSTTSPDEKLDDAPPSTISGWLHWHEPGTSAAEKRLLFKLDWFLLSYSCLSFFMKQVRARCPTPKTPDACRANTQRKLDGNNVSNAYVSGMQADLGFGPGDELSWMNTFFSIGTIIGGVFANLIIIVVRPRYWLPGCLSAWSLLVLGMYRCNTASQFYVLRFFIGLFESAAWPGKYSDTFTVLDMAD